MIRSFRDKRTEALARGRAPRNIPADVARRAVNKLFLLDTVTRLEDLRFLRAVGWRLYREIGGVSTRFASTISGGSASSGAMAIRTKSNSSTTTEGDGYDARRSDAPSRRGLA